MRAMLRISLLVLIAVSLAHTTAAQERQAKAPEKEVRALWVTRWDFRSPEDIQRIIDNCVDLNFNVVLFQVRGNGTVYYPSKIEPWAWELTSDGPETTGKDPGWDPLKVAVKAAREKGIELHAWVNVFPAWRTQKYPPRDSGQLWWEHPDWFMHDAAGRRMIPRDRSVNPKVGDWYSFISPGVPEVQDYLADLFEELVANYEVHGLHYDYVRYPREILEVSEGYEQRVKEMGNWSYDPISLARFTKETGVAGPEADPEKWVQWRADQVTATVRKAAEQTRKHRPELIISAAVMADPVDARATKYQSYVEWMEKGYLDVAITMNYTSDNDVFRQRSLMLLERRPEKGYVVPGMSIGRGGENALAQINITRELKTDGFACFAYSSLFNRNNNHEPRELAAKLKAGPLAEKRPVPW